MGPADRSRGVGAYQIEQVRRGFRDTQQDRAGAGMIISDLADRSRLRRLEIGEPGGEALFGFDGSGQLRSVHEPRGQTMSVRVVLRG